MREFWQLICTTRGSHEEIFIETDSSSAFMQNCNYIMHHGDVVLIRMHMHTRPPVCLFVCLLMSLISGVNKARVSKLMSATYTNKISLQLSPQIGQES